jgi:Uma2 family endonuclease
VHRPLILDGFAMRPLRAFTDPVPVLGPRSAGILLTPEEFDAITQCDEGFLYELIRGVLVVTPRATEAEASLNDELGAMLRRYQREHAQGAILDETTPDCHVRTSSGRQRADRFIWTGLGRCPHPEADVPAIVVDFVSASRRDRRREYEGNRREYSYVGVVEYWVIDRFRRLMTAYRNPPEGSSEVVVREEEIYQTSLLPGFQLPVARLLAVADRWV